MAAQPASSSAVAPIEDNFALRSYSVPTTVSDVHRIAADAASVANSPPHLRAPTLHPEAPAEAVAPEIRGKQVDEYIEELSSNRVALQLTPVRLIIVLFCGLSVISTMFKNPPPCFCNIRRHVA